VPKSPRYYGTLFWDLFNDQDIKKIMHKRWRQIIDYPFVNILMFRECIQNQIVTWQIWKNNLDYISSKMNPKNENMIFL
jgi:hypothetical protein